MLLIRIFPYTMLALDIPVFEALEALSWRKSHDWISLGEIFGGVEKDCREPCEVVSLDRDGKEAPQSTERRQHKVSINAWKICKLRCVLCWYRMFAQETLKYDYIRLYFLSPPPLPARKNTQPQTVLHHDKASCRNSTFLAHTVEHFLESNKSQEKSNVSNSKFLATICWRKFVQEINYSPISCKFSNYNFINTQPTKCFAQSFTPFFVL